MKALKLLKLSILLLLVIVPTDAYSSSQNTTSQKQTVAAPSQGAILYLHGLGDNSSAFKELPVSLDNQAYQLDSLVTVMDELLPNHQHLTPDSPGYGENFQPTAVEEDEALSLEALADYAADIIIQYQGSQNTKKPVLVVGHSMSGIVGLILAKKHPELVKAFINIEGNLGVYDLF